MVGRKRAGARDTATGRFLRVYFEPWIPEHGDHGWLDKKGYMRVYRPDHPGANKSGFAKRHHVVWWLTTGQTCPIGMNIHHLNHIKTDDRIDNLAMMTHGEHSSHHARQAESPIECICEVCGLGFMLPAHRVRSGRGALCSKACYYRRPKSAETRKKQSDSLRRAYAEGRR